MWMLSRATQCHTLSFREENKNYLHAKEIEPTITAIAKLDTVPLRNVSTSYFFSFLLYPASSMAKEPRNLVLRHSLAIKLFHLPTVCRILKVLCIEWQNSTPWFASSPREEILDISSQEGIELTNVAFTVARLCPSEVKHTRFSRSGCWLVR